VYAYVYVCIRIVYVVCACVCVCVCIVCGVHTGCFQRSRRSERSNRREWMEAVLRRGFDRAASRFPALLTRAAARVLFEEAARERASERERESER